MKNQLIYRILGKLLIAYGIFMAVPLVMALWEKETAALTALVASVSLTVLTGSIMTVFGSNEGNIGIREGFLIVAGGWILAGVFGAFPYWFAGVTPGYLDALFEAVSGLTTTGASVLSDVEAVAASILLWRSMTHWIGGMGIIVLFLVFLPNLGMGGVNLFKAEVPGPRVDKVLPRIRDTAIALWLIYVCLTGIEIILLVLTGMPWFDAVNHAFATLATGGFSTKNTSVAHFDNLATELVITFFMFTAGGNFGLYFLAWHKGIRRLLKNTEFKVYAVIVAVSTLLITLSLYAQAEGEIGKSLREALFQVVSIMTTTGFATADFDKWPPVAKMILFVLMFIGGCAGSTAGGIKVIRFILLNKEATATVVRAIHPRLVRRVVVDNKPVSFDILNTTFHFFYFFIVIYVVSVLIVAACGLPAFDALSAVAATLGNIGPGFGIVGPTTTYAEVPDLAKAVLTLDMLFGRLELFTLLVLFHPEFWQPYFVKKKGSY
jgi:trk system potassium uptake protein TrkH